jgi:hypothetical protein
MTGRKKENNLLRKNLQLNKTFLSVHSRLVKPYLTDSPKGSWEIIWHAFLDRFGDDNYNIFVWGIAATHNFLRTELQLKLIKNGKGSERRKSLHRKSKKEHRKSKTSLLDQNVESIY